MKQSSSGTFTCAACLTHVAASSDGRILIGVVVAVWRRRRQSPPGERPAKRPGVSHGAERPYSGTISEAAEPLSR